MKKRYKYVKVETGNSIYIYRCLDRDEQKEFTKWPSASPIGSQTGIVRSAIRIVQAGGSWPVVMAK